jgi:glyoxylase-like metal-dependent hydrolase (beta-lactamase superfamily II)
MIKLKYGNTNTFFIDGLLVDTDWAGTLPAFFGALKKNRLAIKDIKYVMATHYHPDHMGLIGELMNMGVKLLLVDVQKSHVHFSDRIFIREKIDFVPVDKERSEIVSCRESRKFLEKIGISGEIIHTQSHSSDSVSLVLDCGDCFAGDLEPFEYVEAYENNEMLKNDWQRILSLRADRVFFAHAPERSCHTG